MSALCKLSNASTRNSQDKERIQTVDDKNKLRDEIVEELEKAAVDSLEGAQTVLKLFRSTPLSSKITEDTFFFCLLRSSCIKVIKEHIYLSLSCSTLVIPRDFFLF